MLDTSILLLSTTFIAKPQVEEFELSDMFKRVITSDINEKT